MDHKNYPSTTSVATFLHHNDCNTSTFQIPPALVKSYGDVLPTEATFRIDDSGKSWRIKIEKFRDLYFFTDGWKQFAQDVDIKTRDYLLFNSPGLMSPYPVQNNSHKDFYNSGDQTENAVDHEDCFTHKEKGPIDSSWSFMVELKSHNLTRLTIPRKHVNASRVRAAGNLILQDVEGRKWPVSVTGRSPGRLSITAGWREFLIANRVVVGSTMSLKSISSSNNMVEARVVKEGTNKQALFSLVKRIGDRFVVCETDGASGISKGSGSSHKATEHVDGPESYCKASGHAEELEISYKASEFEKGLENIHLKIKSENEDQSPEETNLKELNSAGDQTENAKDEDRFTHPEDGHIDRSWSFMVELKSHNLNQLGLPRKLMNESREKADGNLTLQDVEGRKWPVRVTSRSPGRLSINAGWHNFLVANRVVVGSTMSFKFISCSNNVVEARVVKEGTNRKALFSLVKRIGGRFVVCEPHGASGHSKGSDSSRKANEHVDGPESYCKASDHEDVPQSFHKAREQKADHINIADEESVFGSGWRLSNDRKKRNAEDRQTSNKTSEIEEGPNSSHETTKYANGLEEIHLNSKCERENRSAQEENCFGRKYIFSEELEKKNSREMSESSNKIGKYAEEPENSFKTSENAEVQDSADKRSKYAKDLETIHLDIKGEYEEQCPDEENGFGAGRRWTFSKELKKHNAYKLDIPREFSKVIGKTTGGEIKLEDLKGRKWPVHIEHRKCGAYTMTSGWIDFLVVNKVCIGSTVSFELIPNSDNVIEARVIDKGNAHNELFVKRGKGRPPCS